jgi:23S rRNA (adenine2503-C2)-methyltransferase
MPTRQSFYEFELGELETWFTERGYPPYRARQLFTNVYRRGMDDFGAMTDLPLPLRAELARTLDLGVLRPHRTKTSETENAVKTVWTLADGRQIESVMMSADYRDTVCFSTQVGCAFNCSFCITAKLGRIRQLTSGEIVAQIHHLTRGRDPHSRGANLVAMGMGEPLDNLDALLAAFRILREPAGLNISGRRITVSTVGVVPGIERMAREAPEIRLALSLNATTDAVRRRLMPVTKKYPIEILLGAVEAFTRTTRSRVTLEYVLIRGMNDTPEDADRLGKIAARFPSKVNLIPFNPSEMFPYERPTPEEVNAFARRVWPHNTTVTVRYSKGVDILAACGQLGYEQLHEVS